MCPGAYRATGGSSTDGRMDGKYRNGVSGSLTPAQTMDGRYDSENSLVRLAEDVGKTRQGAYGWEIGLGKLTGEIRTSDGRATLQMRSLGVMISDAKSTVQEVNGTKPVQTRSRRRGLQCQEWCEEGRECRGMKNGGGTEEWGKDQEDNDGRNRERIDKVVDRIQRWEFPKCNRITPNAQVLALGIGVTW
ncbi:hypothetical protein M405DRAFT_846332 [Rhizopogon salebrosus TDB-379]|nr:hypothetical protein M405DRAFT_846332 [Rhizopogon salebrosus TDB-379]